MGWTRGNKLTDRQVKAVKRAFIYRWTTDNEKREYSWRGIGGGPTIGLVSDEEWLKDHAFYITEEGKLSKRHRSTMPWYFDESERSGERPI